MSIDWDGSRMESRGGIDALDDAAIRQVSWLRMLSLCLLLAAMRTYVAEKPPQLNDNLTRTIVVHNL